LQMRVPIAIEEWLESKMCFVEVGGFLDIIDHENRVILCGFHRVSPKLIGVPTTTRLAGALRFESVSSM
jgi:hypothetical protein